MKTEDYEKVLKSGKYDEPFLKKYLEKNKRLDKDNDTLIDIYLTKFGQKNSLDSTLLLVSKYQSGVDNAGFKLLTTNKERLNVLQESPTYYHDMSQHWYFASLLKDVKQKNEANLNKHLELIADFNTLDPIGIDYYYRKEYFKTTDDNERLRKLNADYANHIINMNEDEKKKQSSILLASIREQIEWQAKQSGVTDDKLEEVVKQNMERPEFKYSAELKNADALNDIAWGIYEANKTSIVHKGDVEQAAKWADKGMELATHVPSSWVPIADTYAHLLVLLGQKEKAKNVQQKVIDTAKENNLDGVEDYISFFNEMK